MEKIFVGEGLIAFDSKETVIELNTVKIEVFPSHHSNAMRGFLTFLSYYWMKMTSSLQDSSKMPGT
jgi:hypothetical protein